MLELFEASGWSFVLCTGDFYLFSSADPDAPDLFSDEASRAEALKSLQKSIIIRGLVLAALILIPILVAIIYDRIHWSWLPAGNIPLRIAGALLLLPLSFTLLLLVSVIRRAADLFRLNSLIRQIKNGEPARACRSGKLQNAAYLGLSAAAAAALLLNLAVMRLPSDMYVKLPELSKIEALEVADSEPEYRRDNLSILAPLQIRAERYAEGPELQDPERPWLTYLYRPFLKLRYYRFTFPSIAPLIAKSAMEIDHAVNLSWNYRGLEISGAEYAYYAEAETGGEQHAQMLALMKGGRLAVYGYLGREDLLSHIDVLMQVFE